MSNHGAKPFYAEYYSGWWREMLASTVPKDVPAEFDTLDEARDFAARNTRGRPYAIRVIHRPDRRVVAEYAAGGDRIR